MDMIYLQAPLLHPENLKLQTITFHSQMKKSFSLPIFSTHRSAGNVNILMNLWAATQDIKGEVVDPPFADNRDLHSTIDSIPLGDIPWQGFKVKYTGDIPENAPTWMTKEYDVWFCNPLEVMEAQIGNPDFNNEIDYAPRQVFRSVSTLTLCQVNGYGTKPYV